MRAPPRDLDESGRKLWRVVVRDLEAHGMRDSDLPLVGHYVKALLVADRAWDAVPEHLLSAGSTGQPVAHPALTAAARASEVARALASELRLSPKSREPLQSGRPKGRSKVPSLGPLPSDLARRRALREAREEQT